MIRQIKRMCSRRRFVQSANRWVNRSAMGNAFANYAHIEKGGNKEKKLYGLFGIRLANDRDNFELIQYQQRQRQIHDQGLALDHSSAKSKTPSLPPPPAPPPTLPPPPPLLPRVASQSVSPPPLASESISGHSKNAKDNKLDDDSTAPGASPTLRAFISEAQLPIRTPENPGTVADIHRSCLDIQPTPFDGLKVMISKPVSNHLTLGHALQLSRPNHSAYQFNACFVGDNQHLLTGEHFPMLMGEVDAKGNMTATLLNFFTPRIRSRFTANLIESKIQYSQLSTDYLGDDFTFSFILSNVDLRQRSGVIVASYLQEIVPRLSLGVELIYQNDNTVPGGHAAVVSAVARYQNGTKQWSGAISLNALDMCYSQTYGQCLRASVQMQADIMKRQAISRLAYHCFLPKAQFNFRGAIDTRGVVSAVCEKRLEPLPMLLILSAKMNHVSGHLRLGLGFIFE